MLCLICLIALKAQHAQAVVWVQVAATTPFVPTLQPGHFGTGVRAARPKKLHAGVGDESARIQPTPVKLPAGAMVLDVAAGGTHSTMILGFGGLKSGSRSVM